MLNKINLFEYQNKVEISSSFARLEEFLDEIWNNREKSNFYFDDQEDKVEVQQFLQFLHKTKEIKSNKYVGVIHFEDQKVNLLPKIFYSSDIEYSTNKISAIHNHILWWLSYCRKIKFPNYQTSLGSVKSDFFEVLIYLFSKYTRELLSNAIYQQYEEISNEISFIKGKLNTNKYITESISKGRWHKLNCTYDAFIFDNKFNRIIKYVTTLLFNITTSFENKKHLREILFILDEVSDIRVTPEECASIHFNPMLKDFEIVRDYCYLFLSNSISFDYKNDLKLFAFMLPMEYVFEDFIFGFIEKEIDQVIVKAQISFKYLDIDEKFALRPDLLLQIYSQKIIADTKYKIVYSDEKDPKKGISQNDLYQMLAYAVRFNVDKIILFYPDTIKGYQDKIAEISIEDELAEKKQIRIDSFQLPIINKSLLYTDNLQDKELEIMFEETKNILIDKLNDILIKKVPNLTRNHN